MDVEKQNQKKNIDLEFLIDLARKIMKEDQETLVSNKILATS